MPDLEDVVTPAPSADPIVAPVEPTAQVTGTQDTPHPDRPVDNAVAEFNRKFTKLQSQLDAVIQYTASQQPARVSAPVSQPATVTDDDLWSLAQQGDRQAFNTLQERTADRRIQAVMGTQHRQQIVTSQLQALTHKYPVLNDGSHPLTQTVQRAYQIMTQQGYAPGPATLLEAAKTAIADSPDIVSELYTQGATVRDQVRQSATTRSQSGVMGASPRQDAAPRQATKTASKEELALAKRMGIKDIAGAKARFLQRQEDGISRLGAVGGLVNTEDL